MRGRCKRCLYAGEVFTVTSSTGMQRLCEHCALHGDTPAMNCQRCFPKRGDVSPSG